jgi:hypothetical protein
MGELTSDQRRRIVDALRGLDFPAPRNKLISTALQNGAGQEVLDLPQQFPETADFHELHAVLGVEIPETRPPGGWE